jgi:site-specific DNA recombinase
MSKRDVFGYARLSDKDDRSSSIPSQIKRIQEYCDRHSLNLLKVFIDDGKSGWTFDRPAFIDLEKSCKANPHVNFLIISHFDRFSRADPIDAMVKERQFRDKLKVKVLQVSESPDTDTDTSTYQIIRFMQAFAANEERNRIVERVKTAMRFRMLQGRYCASAPFGYVNKRDEKGEAILKIDEGKAQIIRYIFKLYLAGHKFEEIRKLATEKGFTVKGKVVIQKVLSSPLYAGLINVPAYKNQPAKMVKAVHEPIVPEAMYWQVQERLSPKRFTPQKRDEVPLRGVLKCQHCGKLLTAAPSKSRSGKYYWYYFCNEDRKENYSAIKVHERFDSILDEISINGAYFTRLKEKMFSSIQVMINTQTKDLMKITLQIRNTEQSIEDIETKYLEDNVSPATFKKVMVEKKSTLSDLLAKKEILNLNATDYLGRLDDVMNKASSVRTLFEQMNLASKQRFIRQVFGSDIKYTPSGFRTTFIHPIFEFKANSINFLIKEKQTGEPAFSENTADVSPEGGVTNHRELVESLFTIFAA